MFRRSLSEKIQSLKIPNLWMRWQAQRETALDRSVPTLQHGQFPNDQSKAPSPLRSADALHRRLPIPSLKTQIAALFSARAFVVAPILVAIVFACMNSKR